MNLVIQMGRLARDPEIRYTPGDNPMAVVRFAIAVDRRFKREGQSEADFHNCVAFGKTAEFIEKYFSKGSKIAIIGEMRNNNYRGNDGNMIYREEIVVNNAEFCESKTAQSNSRKNVESPIKTVVSTNRDDFMEIPDGMEEEIPFS